MEKKVIYNFFNNLFEQITKNIKLIIYSVLVFIFFLITYQIYLFKQNAKILELSILYDQAKANINSVEFNQNMNLIAQENGIYGNLASLELIKNKLSNKDYNGAYIDYLNLLNG